MTLQQGISIKSHHHKEVITEETHSRCAKCFIYETRPVYVRIVDDEIKYFFGKILE